MDYMELDLNYKGSYVFNDYIYFEVIAWDCVFTIKRELNDSEIDIATGLSPFFFRSHYDSVPEDDKKEFLKTFINEFECVAVDYLGADERNKAAEFASDLSRQYAAFGKRT